MRIRARVVRRPAGAGLTLTAILGLLTLPVLSQQGGEPETAPPAAPAAAESVIAPDAEVGQYLGPATCASSSCHGSTEPRDAFEVLQNEYFTWLQQDRHSKAHEVLYDEQSRLIARNLGLAGRPVAEPACLACHALTPPPEQVGGHLELEDGISCEACHGPAGGWRGPHTEEGWATRDSVARGMVDLSSATTRAELCLACHQGEGVAGSDRRVDHRLIAAGHPRLTFELDNFSARMPEHWRPRPPLEASRQWALGQLSALREELELVRAAAAEEGGPQLALMSCEDCHHSLGEERWRDPDRRPEVAALPAPRLGLPRWSPARWAVLRHLVRRVEPRRTDALDRELAELSRQIGSLGPAAAAAEEARAALAILEPVITALGEMPWSEGTVRALLASITGDPALATDLPTAEQAFWATNTLASVLIRRHPEASYDRLRRAAEALYQTLDDPHGYDPARFRAAMERVQREVRRLP